MSDTIQLLNDVELSASHAENIVKDLVAIRDTMSLLSKADALHVGLTLSSVLSAAREHYKSAWEACTCGFRPEACQCGQGAWAELGAETDSRMVPVSYQCPNCDRTYSGAELVLEGTPAELRLCGLCIKAAEKAKASMPVVTEVSQPLTERIPDGTYTIVFSDDTERTIKIKTQDDTASFAPGKTIASYLNGPDNWTNYQGFAFVNADNSFRVWSKYQGAETLVRALAALTSGKEAVVDGLKAYGMASGKCGLCGRKLTKAESILAAIGPVCRQRIGL